MGWWFVLVFLFQFKEDEFITKLAINDMVKNLLSLPNLNQNNYYQRALITENKPIIYQKKNCPNQYLLSINQRKQFPQLV